MTPLELLRAAIGPLSESGAHFALAGGLAASFYRDRPRLTNDVDICLLADPESETQNVALRIIEKLGLTAYHGWISSSGKLSDSLPLLIGKVANDEREATLDILLPSFPWLKQGVIRAQENVVDFGFARVPMLTPEDLLVAKQYALSIEPNRHQDLDDVQSILRQQNDIDDHYLSTECRRLGLPFPPSKN